MLHLYAALAEKERRLIGDRTRAAFDEWDALGHEAGHKGHVAGEPVQLGHYDRAVWCERRECDKIDLSAIDAKSGPAGDQAFKFIHANGFHDKKGELRFANHKVQGDVDGDGKSDFQIKLVGVDSLVKFDFVL